MQVSYCFEDASFEVIHGTNLISQAACVIKIVLW